MSRPSWKTSDVIALTDLEFTYPDSGFSLTVSDLEVPQGERLAIVGASGSGKTTLLNLIAGLVLPNRGTIRFDGQSVGSLTDAGRRDLRINSIGFVFQSFELVEYLNARENILYPFRISDALALTTEARNRADVLAEKVGLLDKLDRYPSALSQGERQRLAICRALVTKPKLVLADEATGNLDPDNKTLILDLLFERVAEDGATLIAVTHDHALLDRFDRVIDFNAFRRGKADG